MPNQDVIGVELFIDDTKADAVLSKNKAKLEGFGRDVESLKPVLTIEGIEKAEQKAANLRNALKDIGKISVDKGISDLGESATKTAKRVGAITQELGSVKELISRGASKTILAQYGNEAALLSKELDIITAKTGNVIKLNNEAVATEKALIAREKSLGQNEQQLTKGVGRGLGIPLGVATGAAFAGYEGVRFLEDAVKASFEAEKSNRSLAASATEAGVAYDFLQKKSEDFARQSGLSRIDAQTETGKLAHLSQTSGLDFDKVKNALLNRTSAFSVDTKDIGKLADDLDAGGGRAILKNLGVDETAALKKYAAQLGKTTDELTRREQIQAKLLPILQQTADYEDANAERLASFSGQAETANARLSDLYTNFGEGLTNSFQFRQSLQFINDLLSSMGTNIDDVRKKLKEGVTPEKIADDELNKPGSQILGGISSFGNIFFGLPLIAKDTYTDGAQTALSNYWAGISPQHLRDAMKQNLLPQIANEKKAQDKQNEAAQKQAATNNNLRNFDDFQSSVKQILKPEQGADIAGGKKLKAGVADELAAKLDKIKSQLTEDQIKEADKEIFNTRSKFYIERSDEAFKRFSKSNPTLSDGVSYKKSLDGIKQFLPEDKFESFNDTLDNFFKKIGKTKTEFAGFLSSARAPENPFVKIFSEIDTVGQRAEERFHSLGQAAVDLAAKTEKSALELQAFNTNLNNKFDVFDLRESAEKFRHPALASESKEAFQKRFDETVRASSSFAQNPAAFLDNENLARAQQLYAQGKLKKEELEQIQQQKSVRDADVYNFAQYSAVSNLNAPGSTFDELNKKIAIQSLAREMFAKPIDVDANLGVQQRLDKQLAIADSFSPKTDDQKSALDRKIIALTSGLDPSKLNDRERSEAASAREREADRKDNYEKDALKELRSQNSLLAQMLGALTGGVKLDPDSAITIKVDANGNVSTSVLPKSPTPKDTERAMQENYSGGTFYDEYQNR